MRVQWDHDPNSILFDKNLVKWVGSGAPVSEEQAEADGLEDSSENTHGDGIHWSLLSDDAGDNLEIQLAFNLEVFQSPNVHLVQQTRRRSASRGKRRPCS